MAALREMTGVCPQHNILFDLLTCAEHLRLFAGLKGVPEDQIEKEVPVCLTSSLSCFEPFLPLFSKGHVQVIYNTFVKMHVN